MCVRAHAFLCLGCVCAHKRVRFVLVLASVCKYVGACVFVYVILIINSFFSCKKDDGKPICGIILDLCMVCFGYYKRKKKSHVRKQTHTCKSNAAGLRRTFDIIHAYIPISLYMFTVHNSTKETCRKTINVHFYHKTASVAIYWTSVSFKVIVPQYRMNKKPSTSNFPLHYQTPIPLKRSNEKTKCSRSVKLANNWPFYMLETMLCLYWS